MNRILTLVFLASLFAISVPLGIAGPKAESSGEAFKRFSTAGHEKSKGLNMEIAYPIDWVGREGERPNVVQLFVSEGGAGPQSAMIITKKLSIPEGATLSEEGLDAILDPKEMVELLPAGASFIGARPTKIDGLRAGILEYSMVRERAGSAAAIQIILYMFVYNDLFVTLQCAVNNTFPQDAALLARQMDSARPTFFRIADSIVLPDKWK
jgi:hypothetical protein